MALLISLLQYSTYHCPAWKVKSGLLRSNFKPLTVGERSYTSLTVAEDASYRHITQDNCIPENQIISQKWNGLLTACTTSNFKYSQFKMTHLNPLHEVSDKFSAPKQWVSWSSSFMLTSQQHINKGIAFFFESFYEELFVDQPSLAELEINRELKLMYYQCELVQLNLCKFISTH